jgi:hypothetical protein
VAGTEVLEVTPRCECGHFGDEHLVDAGDETFPYLSPCERCDCEDFIEADK